MLPAASRLVVQPDDGLGPVRQFLESAQSSLLIKQFTFTEESLIQRILHNCDFAVAGIGD